MTISMIPWVPGAEPFVLTIAWDIYTPAAWLVYADWLEEHGYCIESEFCRSLFPNERP